MTHPDAPSPDLIGQLLQTVHRPNPDVNPDYWHVTAGKHTEFGRIMSALASARSIQAEPAHWHNGAGQTITHAEKQAAMARAHEEEGQFAKRESRYTEPLYAHPPAPPSGEVDQGEWSDGGKEWNPSVAHPSGEVDWQLAAFDTTLNLATERAMHGDGALSIEHLIDMRYRMQPDFSPAKMGRWLGWAQAAVVASGCGTLDEMKEINRKASEAARSALVPSTVKSGPTPPLVSALCKLHEALLARSMEHVAVVDASDLQTWAEIVLDAAAALDRAIRALHAKPEEKP